VKLAGVLNWVPHTFLAASAALDEHREESDGKGVRVGHIAANEIHP